MSDDPDGPEISETSADETHAHVIANHLIANGIKARVEPGLHWRCAIIVKRSELSRAKELLELDPHRDHIRKPRYASRWELLLIVFLVPAFILWLWLAILR